MSYSQGGEEAVLLDVLDVDGRFLDLGAADGVTFSNTAALTDRGWSGVSVECSPRYLVALQQRARTLVVAAAVMPSPAPAGLRRFADSPDLVGTLDPANEAKWERATKFQALWLPVVTLEAVLAVHPGPYQCVSVDLEGQSRAVAGDLRRHCASADWWPRAVVIEHDGAAAELIEDWSPHGYVCAYRDPNNIILVTR